MDRTKLQNLREKVEALTLPKLPPKQSYHHGLSHDEAGQKTLAAAAITATGLLNKAKLACGAAHQKKLVALADQLKATSNNGFSSTARLPLAALHTARTSLLRILKVVDAESRKVFIVHGRDEAMRKEAQATLHRFGIDGIILFEEINEGQTIIEKFDREARACGYAVVLFSPDDMGGIRVGKTAPKLSPRARQNVVLELGYFVACSAAKTSLCWSPAPASSSPATSTAWSTKPTTRPAPGSDAWPTSCPPKAFTPTPPSSESCRNRL